MDFILRALIFVLFSLQGSNLIAATDNINHESILGAWQTRGAHFGNYAYDECLLVIEESSLYFYDKWAKEQVKRIRYSIIETGQGYYIIELASTPADCFRGGKRRYLVLFMDSDTKLSIGASNTANEAIVEAGKEKGRYRYYRIEKWTLDGKVCEVDAEPYVSIFMESENPKDRALALFCLNVRGHPEREQFNVRGFRDGSRPVHLKAFSYFTYKQKTNMEFYLETLFGDYPQGARRYALDIIVTDLTNNGDTSYGRGNFQYLLPHIDEFIDLMEEPAFAVPIYLALTREFGVGCYTTLGEEHKAKITEALRHTGVNSASWLDKFKRHEQVCKPHASN